MSLAEWTETTVGQASDFLTGFPFVSSGFAESGVRLIRGSNVKRGIIDWSPDIARYWPEGDSTLRAFVLRDGDIVIAMDGALVGRSFARISKSDLPAYLVQRVARLRGKAIDQGLLYQWIGSRDFARHVDDVKTHTAIPHISPRDIRDFTISMPKDLTEQRRISMALRHADELIAVLERLIVKKQAIKQGMMQQLLAGRTRLPGFVSTWQETEMCNFTHVDPEALTASHNPGALIDYISLDDVERGEILGHTSMPFGSAPSRARRVVAVGDILFGTVRPNLQSHAIYIGGLSRPIASTGFAVVRAIDGRSDSRFIFYLLMSDLTTAQIDRIIAGSNYPAVSSGDIRRLSYSLPPVDEQRAIGVVLGECESEISTLKRRLEKARAVKSGMMQQLLNGRVRLPVKVAS